MESNQISVAAHRGRRVRAVVVTPTYEEKECIADLIAAVLAEQPRVPEFELHILVADGHSQDGTIEIVQRLAETDSRIHLLDVHERGMASVSTRVSATPSNTWGHRC